GNVGAVTAQTGVQVGVYNIAFTAATKFDVFDPIGHFVAEGSTGVAFANQLGFPITAGGTAFVDGDGFTITVVAGSNKVVPLNLSGIDGSAVPIGVVVSPSTVPPTGDSPTVFAGR